MKPIRENLVRQFTRLRFLIASGIILAVTGLAKLFTVTGERIQMKGHTNAYAFLIFMTLLVPSLFSAEFPLTLPDGTYLIESQRRPEPTPIGPFESIEEAEAWVEENPRPSGRSKPVLFRIHLSGSDFVLRSITVGEDGSGDSDRLHSRPEELIFFISISENGSWYYDKDEKSFIVSDVDVRAHSGGPLGVRFLAAEATARQLRYMGLNHIDWSSVKHINDDQVTGVAYSDQQEFNGTIQRGENGQITSITYYIKGRKYEYKADVEYQESEGYVSSVSRWLRTPGLEQWRFDAKYEVIEATALREGFDSATYWEEFVGPETSWAVYDPAAGDFDNSEQAPVTENTKNRNKRIGLFFLFGLAAFLPVTFLAFRGMPKG